MPTPSIISDATPRQIVERQDRIFAPYPQLSSYFPSSAMEDARHRATRAIDRGDGPALVVGAAGTGKSLLLQLLAAHYQKRFDVVLLACARICTRRALLQSILFELGLSYRPRDEGRLRLGLLDHLLSENQTGSGLLLLIDEAQALSIAILDELRVMTNLVRAGAPRVRLVLAGLSALEESFADPQLESFNQRLTARSYLAPMGRDETGQFVRHQLTAAGVAPESVLAADACEAIFEATDGVPRLVNQVCDRAFILAADENCSQVDRRWIQAAWTDLQQLPTSWSSQLTAQLPTEPGMPVVEFGTLDELQMPGGEPAILEPTEIDVDADFDDVLEIKAELETSPRAISTDAETALPRTATRPTPDPSNPFSEEFDEEEVILDGFAAWDELFPPGIQRVENRRDRKLARLVGTALEAAAAQPDPSSGDSCAKLHVLPVVSMDSPETADTTRSDDPDANRPRLRLAIVSDLSGPEIPLANTSSQSKDVRDHGNYDSPTAYESPILVIEDESAATKHRGSPVRRLAYQHLFSRLRSG